MNSTLPDFSAAIPAAAAPTGLNPAAAADFNTIAGAASAPAGDFAALLPDPAAAPVATPPPNATAGTPGILSLCVPAAGTTVAGTTPVATATEVSEISPAVSRDTLEQAAAFAAALMQAFLPETKISIPQALADGTLEGGGPARPAGQAFGSPFQAAPAVPVPANGSTRQSPASAPEFQITAAADGAVELKLNLPDAAPRPDPAVSAGTPVEIQAELELPGQAVVRLEAGGSIAIAAGQAESGRAIFAGKKPAPKAARDGVAATGERNFVFTGDKQVKPRSPEAGIAVAKTDANMPAAPIEEIQTSRSAAPSSALPVRPEFQVVPAPAERITAPAPVPAGQNFAERAVATVTGLVEAQFSASMQKSGSVQLRLKFGGEDLGVRVELRGGAVHTNFHTDSAELRAALTRELQAFAAQSPEQMRRYVEPVFSPGPAGSSDQPAARQQAAQQDLPQRAPRPPFEEAAPFARRSLLRESFFPEPVAPRVPALLPTSLRLSALA